MGKLQASPVPAMAARGISHFYEYNDRIACGSSCAPSGENYSGTIGALVSDGKRMLGLSNNHVFAACNHMPVGMPILSPATMDARPDRRAPTEICRHESMVGWATLFCPPFTNNNGGQKSVAHPTKVLSFPHQCRSGVATLIETFDDCNLAIKTCVTGLQTPSRFGL